MENHRKLIKYLRLMEISEGAFTARTGGRGERLSSSAVSWLRSLQLKWSHRNSGPADGRAGSTIEYLVSIPTQVA